MGIFPFNSRLNYITHANFMQHEIFGEVLQDFDLKGTDRDWSGRKMANELLATAYDQVNDRKAARLRECATTLIYSSVDGGKRLTGANFCRVRLCPICQWRRSLKAFGQTTKIINAIENERERAYILLTLTTKNCTGDELSPTIDKMMAAWNSFSRRARWKKVALGWCRSMEVTHNVDVTSKSYDTYHPHFHVLICVNKSYFTSRDYIPHAEWVEMWRASMGVKYQPRVNIEKCRKIEGSVAEITKYTTAEEDYIIPDDWDLTVDSVRTLEKALTNRRFIAYGGLFAEWHRKLNLTDVEDGDLVDTDNQDETADTTGVVVVYRWYSGYRQYRREQ